MSTTRGPNGNDSQPRTATASRHAAAMDRSIPGWRQSLQQVCDYLEKRRSQKALGDDTFGVVFAITKFCNLACRHCAVGARYLDRSIATTDGDLSKNQILNIIDKVRRYGVETKLPVFFMFGGGEPTLREDFQDILKHAAGAFGETNVGFCTNGTYRPVSEVIELAQHVGLLEVSLDGFEAYHNAWRTPGQEGFQMNAFDRTVNLIKAAVGACPDKLEVTSVVTRDNLSTLPDFVRFVRGLGARNYSIHRPIPVGRMASQRSKIPSIAEYYYLLASMATVAAENECFQLHLHHSLESVHSALLLGADIHWSDLPMGSRRHSIGISWDGSVHFDPWSLVPPFHHLSPGNLLENGKELADFWHSHDSILGLVAHAKKANVRCRRCPEKCSGGMRLSAMTDFLIDREDELTLGDILAAVSSVDPACPLHTNQS